jgi:hypothetical protein
LREAASHLNEDRMLEQLESELRELPFLWLDTADSTGEVFSLSRSDLETMKSS